MPTRQKLDLTRIVIAHDGIAVIVNTDNPVQNLSTDQLRDIYAGKMTNWSQVGGDDLTIQLVNRDEASGTREAFDPSSWTGPPSIAAPPSFPVPVKCAMS